MNEATDKRRGLFGEHPKPHDQLLVREMVAF
jgi:hypothetical protein